MGNSFTERLVRLAGTLGAGAVLLTFACASQSAPVAQAKPPELPARGAHHDARLKKTLAGATATTGQVLREYFEVGYASSRRDYANVRAGHLALAKHIACRASLDGVLQSDSLRARAGIDRSTLETLAIGCNKWSDDVAEDVMRGLPTGRGPAHAQDRLRVAHRAAELDPDNSRRLREVVIESFEEGYLAGLEDRPGGTHGALNAAEKAAVVKAECTHLAGILERDDLRASICEAATRNFEARQIKPAAGHEVTPQPRAD